MWDKNGNRFGTRTWAQALSDANGLSLGGHSDWRLPNVNELESLINAEENSASWLNGKGFSGVVAGGYWSSTTSAPHTTFACYVYLFDGNVVSYVKTNNYYVLAVRAGQ